MSLAKEYLKHLDNRIKIMRILDNLDIDESMPVYLTLVNEGVATRNLGYPLDRIKKALEDKLDLMGVVWEINQALV